MVRSSRLVRSSVCLAFLLAVPPAQAFKIPESLQGLGNLGKALFERPSFSDADEEKMARANAQKFEASNKMWADPLLDAYLNGLMQKVLAVAHPRPFQYTIRVVSDGSINAFTFGGGALYIHAGLLARRKQGAQVYYKPDPEAGAERERQPGGHHQSGERHVASGERSGHLQNRHH